MLEASEPLIIVKISLSIVDIFSAQGIWTPEDWFQAGDNLEKEKHPLNTDEVWGPLESWIS